MLNIPLSLSLSLWLYWVTPQSAFPFVHSQLASSSLLFNPAYPLFKTLLLHSILCLSLFHFASPPFFLLGNLIWMIATLLLDPRRHTSQLRQNDQQMEKHSKHLLRACDWLRVDDVTQMFLGCCTVTGGSPSADIELATKTLPHLSVVCCSRSTTTLQHHPPVNCVCF